MPYVQFNNLSVRSSTDINYVWVLFNGPVSNQDFEHSLTDESFHAFLKKTGVNCLLLDCSRLGTFSIPDMSDHLDKQFTIAMQQIGIKNISVLLEENVLSMLQFIFRQIETDHANTIRFFSPDQFTQSAEAVEWFD